MKAFQKIKVRKPQSASFDLSHEKSLTCNMGDLVPIMIQDILPGDKFSVNSEIFIRLAPMIAPTMSRVNVFTHHWFVPYRIIMDEWQDLITGGEDGTADPLFPTIKINDTTKAQFQKGKLSDYMGIPPVDISTTVTQELEVSALPFRAYAKIFNENYRDQNLVTKVVQNTTGEVTSGEQGDITIMRKRAWEKDYFTSALPFAQKGDPVALPVNVQYKEVTEVYNSNTGDPNEGPLQVNSVGLLEVDELGVPYSQRLENLDKDALSFTIEQLRVTSRLQEWLEKNARGGSRYIESILSHFGVKSSDARLQRPEYLGGGKQAVVISEVLSTFDAQAEGLPQGNMSGHGISIGKTNRFKKSFEEHGVIISLMSVLPRTNYAQGIENFWFKSNKFDFAWPEFSQLGEQILKLKELYVDYAAPADTGDKTFGYQSRYAEYKYKQGSVHGDFRGNMKYWTLYRDFDTEPALNSEFIQSNPSHRIFAVEDETEDKLYVQVYNSVRAIRPLPLHNIPKL